LQPLQHATTQVWYSAVASPSGHQGTISSSVQSSGGDGASGLVIEAIHVLGVPRAGARRAAQATPRMSIKGVPSMVVNGQANRASLDVQTGTLKLTGLRLPAREALEVSWSL
jgi:hypothetical protein